MSNKKKILVFIDWFLPGIKAGGPIKSVSALVNHLSDQFDFFIITSDKDFGENEPYKNILSNSWLEFKPGVKIIYLSSDKQSKIEIKNQILNINPDTVYLNSFFSYSFSILPLLVLNKISFTGKIILAPRGMLSEGALRIKPFKKRFFLAISKFIQFHKKVIWHSTKADETSDIKRNFKNALISEIQNIPNIQLRKDAPELSKKEGELNLIYLGRIAENKNLKKILEVFLSIEKGKINLSVYGFIEDETYWKECKKITSKLPHHIKVEYKGILNEEEVRQKLTEHHYLIMLSYSENFGHAIVESLSCGTPVIIGEKTPWQNLEKHNAGWNVKIYDDQHINKIISSAISISEEAYINQRKDSLKYASAYCFSNKILTDYKILFG